MPFAAASSEHPDAAHGVGEVVGSLLEAGLGAPDLAVLFVAGHDAAVTEDVADAVRRALGPKRLLGTTAVSVVGGGHEIEERPAVSLWAASGIGPTRPLALTAVQADGGYVIAGMPPAGSLGSSTLLVLADPFSFPTDAFIGQLAENEPGVQAVGGLASAGAGPGGNRLVLDGFVGDEGAVAVALEGDHRPDLVVSQGCRPIGDAVTVTASERNLLLEVAGRPALDHLRDVLAALGPDDRALAETGLHVGRVIDEQRDEFERGDFLIRAVTGADPERGAVAIGDVPSVGSVVQFQVRDAEAADEDLRAMLGGRAGDAALVFTCNGRGSRFFGEPDHDAGLVHDLVDGGPTAGMFCAGEIGPVGGRTFVHGYTASVALFRDA